MDATPPGETGTDRAGLRLGISTKLLLLTILFVMLAEVLIYLPSIANFRRNWLNDRLAAAQVAVMVLEGAPVDGLPEGTESRLLMGVGARAIAARVGGARRLLSLDAMPPEVAHTVDLRNQGWTDAVTDALAVLLRPEEQRPIRVVGEAVGAADFVEIVLDEGPLRRAMLRFSINILLLSLLISGLTACLVFFALQWLIVRPIRLLADNVMQFEAEPDNPRRIIVPSGRADEIGEAEEALARMQKRLAGDLRAQKHLADLGLAVSKINHDLRNILAAAQLMSDQLAGTRDPKIRRFAPRLMATLDRAIAFCEATLVYGRVHEADPVLKPVALRQIVAETGELLGLAPGHAISFANEVAADLIVPCDADQMSRVLMNLMRNAVQALTQNEVAAPTLHVVATAGSAAVVLRVRDNGPGVPERAKDHLFQAFRGSASPGGTGLGLAIAAELVKLHGGTIMLEPSAAGAVFRVDLPLKAA